MKLSFSDLSMDVSRSPIEKAYLMLFTAVSGVGLTYKAIMSCEQLRIASMLLIWSGMKYVSTHITTPELKHQVSSIMLRTVVAGTGIYLWMYIMGRLIPSAIKNEWVFVTKFITVTSSLQAMHWPLMLKCSILYFYNWLKNYIRASAVYCLADEVLQHGEIVPGMPEKKEFFEPTCTHARWALMDRFPSVCIKNSD